MKNKWAWVITFWLLAMGLIGKGVAVAAEPPALVLVREASIADLAAVFDDNDKKLEASGVTRLGEHFYIVLDDYRRLGRIHESLTPGHADNGFYCGELPFTGLEGMTTDAQGRLLAVEEFNNDGAGVTPGRVLLLAGCNADSQTGRLQQEVYVPTRLGLGLNSSKGFEGITYLRRNGLSYLLLLCEGNRCAYSKRPGDGNPYDGQILVYEMKPVGADGKDFELVYRDRIRLWGQADFADYSGIAMAPDGRIGVISQTDQKLWLGRFTTASGWQVKSEGVYRFPLDSEHQRNHPRQIHCGGPAQEHAYKNVEGLFFLNDNEMVMVSDKKKNTTGKCKAKSIAIFKLP